MSWTSSRYRAFILTLALALQACADASDVGAPDGGADAAPDPTARFLAQGADCAERLGPFLAHIDGAAAGDVAGAPADPGTVAGLLADPEVAAQWAALWGRLDAERPGLADALARPEAFDRLLEAEGLRALVASPRYVPAGADRVLASMQILVTDAGRVALVLDASRAADRLLDADTWVATDGEVVACAQRLDLAATPADGLEVRHQPLFEDRWQCTMCKGGLWFARRGMCGAVARLGICALAVNFPELSDLATGPLCLVLAEGLCEVAADGFADLLDWETGLVCNRTIQKGCAWTGLCDPNVPYCESEYGGCVTRGDNADRCSQCQRQCECATSIGAAGIGLAPANPCNIAGYLYQIKQVRGLAPLLTDAFCDAALDGLMDCDGACAEACGEDPPPLPDDEPDPAPVERAPCADLEDGWYCADNGPRDWEGAADDLLFCDGGVVTRVEACVHGCQRNRQGTNDQCRAAPAEDAGGLVFPFAQRAGHPVTDTPDGHAGRTPHRNWDLDCAFGDGVGALISGVVTDDIATDLPRGADHGYGNRVCVRNAARGLTVCHNHLEAGSVVVAPGCRVEAGERIGGCGNSGFVIPLGGGDGTHLDVYAVDAQGADVELPHPDTWGGPASLAASDCAGVEACAPPTLVSPNPDATDVRRPTTLSWRAAPCGDELAARYRVQVVAAEVDFPDVCEDERADDAACLDRLAHTAVVDVTRAVIDALAPCTEYAWRVRAGRHEAGGHWSPPRHFTTAGCDPVEPPPPGCPDDDGDGHRDADCGGDDCDDADPDIRPGRAERCDRVDQDCDDRVDEAVGGGALTRPCASECGEGVEVCRGGAFVDCSAPVQCGECDPADGPRACYEGPAGTQGRGLCRAGERRCRADRTWGECVDQVRPRAEVACNGVDEDCDGQDNGCPCPNGAANACGGCDPLNGGVGDACGRCGGGELRCDGPDRLECVGDRINRCGDCGREPDERCDGEDNDCDDRVDEHVVNACGGCAALAGRPGDACGRCGELRCDGPDRIECVGDRVNGCGDCGPNPADACDGRDDDCDGDVDEDAVCGGGRVCRDGACRAACEEAVYTVEACALHLGEACPGFEYSAHDGWWARFRDSARFRTRASGGHFVAHATVDGGAHAVTGTWSRAVPPGEYEVDIHMPNPDPADPTGAPGDCLDRWDWGQNIPWRLFADGNPAGAFVVNTMNQAALPGGWSRLNRGAPVRVERSVSLRVSNDTGRHCRTVAFDAVRFRRVCP